MSQDSQLALLSLSAQSKSKAAEPKTAAEALAAFAVKAAAAPQNAVEALMALGGSLLKRAEQVPVAQINPIEDSTELFDIQEIQSLEVTVKINGDEYVVFSL
jgi:hypothetical protein